MKKILTFCFIVWNVVSQGQTFEWLQTPAVTYDANPDMIGYSNTVDASGNILIAGYRGERYLYGSVFGHLLLDKYAPTGELLFSKTFEGHGQLYNLKTDSLGNIFMLVGYVGVFSYGDLNLNTVQQGIQPLLLKLNPDGDLLWHLPLNTIDPFIEQAEALTVDSAHNCYVAFGNFGEVYIQKISPEGSVLTTLTQSHLSRITSLAIDTEQNLYAAGSCASNDATYAGVNVAPITAYNTFVVKFSPEGTFQWVRYVEDVTCPSPMVVARNPDEVYFCSYLFGPFAFGNHTTEGPAAGSFSDFFLTRLNRDGDFQWVREVPGDSFGEFELGRRNFLSLDSSGKIYLGGSTSRTINWGNSILSDIPGNNSDAALLQYDSDGTIEQVVTGGGSWSDRFDGITVDSGGAIYASGIGYGDTQFGGLTHNSSAYFPFLTKINSALKTENYAIEATQFYPNPATDELHFHNVDAKNGSIYNMLGQLVQRFSISTDQKISISGLPSGTYLIHLDGFHAQKLLKK